jgi:threonine/homoserine/homoserine lactone efflux protein
MLSAGGIELLPPLGTFLAFVIAGLALNIVPGADMTFVIASAARGGRRDGVIAALGIGAGTLVHISAAVLGLSAILASSATAFSVIKWVGAAYLLYIALSLVISGKEREETEAAPRRSGWQLFRAAMLVNVLNPKVALFFLAFLPQFVDAKAGVPALQILCLGLWFDFAGTAVNAIIAVIAAGAASRLRGLSSVSSGARYLAATLMGALALRLVLAERR